MENKRNFFGKTDTKTWAVRHAKTMKVGNKPINRFVKPEKVEQYIKNKKFNHFDLVEQIKIEKGKNGGLYKLTFQFNG